jgi:hypothetical protein
MADQTFTVNLEVAHSGGRAWHWVAAEFDERLSDQVIPPVLSADLVAELRRGRDGLRLRIAVTVQAADIAEAVGVAWDVLEDASQVGGFHLASATVDAGPAPLLLSSYRGLARRPLRRRPPRRGIALPGHDETAAGPSRSRTDRSARLAGPRPSPGANGDALA